MPDNFVIGIFDVTEHWVKNENGKWVKCSGKTDLSYSQILSAIDHIKESYSITDSQIAQLQLWVELWGLARSTKAPGWTAKLKPLEREQVVIFLDYLNALMFGVEASGLNASLLISAMMLDLIANSQYSYKIAFKVNDHGGMYPYACFGNNKGTYNERERAMLLDPPSMCAWRNRPELSPVAIKEAILIKVWLKYSGVLDTKLTYEEQRKRIDHAMRDLQIFYFSPWLRYCYSIERFRICPERNHTEDVYTRENKGITM